VVHVSHVPPGEHATPAQVHWFSVAITCSAIGTNEKEIPITDSNPEPITSRVNGIGIWIIWINEAIDDTINAADTKSAARNKEENPLGTPLTRQVLLAHELPTFVAPVFCLSPKVYSQILAHATPTCLLQHRCAKQIFVAAISGDHKKQQKMMGLCEVREKN
jgi:hypothetical protein